MAGDGRGLASRQLVIPESGASRTFTRSADQANVADAEDNATTVVPKEEVPEGDQLAENVAKVEPQTLQIEDEQLPQLTKAQERTLRKTRMLAPKADMELQQLEATPPGQSITQDPTANDPTATEAASPKQIDPEEAKAGLRKAIELAPKAVSEMELTLQSLGQKDWHKASVAAEVARRILEEIQQAQPKKEQNQNEQQQDQNKQQDEQKQNEDQKDQSKENKSEEKENEEKQDKSKDEQQSEEKKSPQDQKQTKPQVSQERMAEALRKVRERQQEKQDRDRQFRAQILGRAPVDKDW